MHELDAIFIGSANDKLITITVGDRNFTIHKNILDKIPGIFPTLIHDFKGNTNVLDGDPLMFRHVLNYLRHDLVLLPDDFKEHDLLCHDATRYNLPELHQIVFEEKYAADMGLAKVGWICLKVGTRLYETSLDTVCRESKHILSMLEPVVSDQFRNQMWNPEGKLFFVDRNGEIFGKILEYLRNGYIAIMNSDVNLLGQIREIRQESNAYQMNMLKHHAMTVTYCVLNKLHVELYWSHCGLCVCYFSLDCKPIVDDLFKRHNMSDSSTRIDSFETSEKGMYGVARFPTLDISDKKLDEKCSKCSRLPWNTGKRYPIYRNSFCRSKHHKLVNMFKHKFDHWTRYVFSLR